MTVTRLKRFIHALLAGLVLDLRVTARTHAYFPTVRRFARTVRRAWVTSDPGWSEIFMAPLRTALSPEEIALGEQEQRRREEARGKLADTPAVYEGALEARMAMRGTRLDDHDDTDRDIETWLTNVLALDDWHGDRVENVRIIVELLDRDPS